MRIGLMIGGANADELVDQAQRMEELGFDSLWMANTAGYRLETLSAVTLIAQATNRIELGTAVIPIFLHHPLALAHATCSIQKVAGGRFTLGVGLSHAVVVEGWLGLSYDKPVSRLEEYLAILLPLLNGETAAFEGTYFSANAAVHLADVEPVSLLVAALGPRMLKLAGELTAGTVTYLTGPRTLESFTIPRIRSAAEGSGRPSPRVVAAGLPIALVSDVAAARESIAQQYAFYGDLPSYRAMFEREGVANAGEIAIVGDETALGRALDHLADIGVTDFVASLVPAGENAVDRTIDFLTNRSS
jgi:5,10-methylenetetrahydromethanopterin reductase